MTAPKRAKARRMFVALDECGLPCAVDDEREDLGVRWGHDCIIEVAPVPRVTVRRMPENDDAWEKFAVSVNGVDVFWTDAKWEANERARDLRRALKGT